MKKLMCLCLTSFFAYASIAEARVEFIVKEGELTHSVKTTKCASNEQRIGNKCYPICSENEYPFTSKPDERKGVVVTCSGVKTRYKYSKCNNGYVWNSTKTDCVERDCSDYPLTTVDRNIGQVEECQSGDTITYKYISCVDGWILKNGKCEIAQCSEDFPFGEGKQPDATVGTYGYCKTGNLTYWGYTSCYNSDYQLVKGKCLNRCRSFPSTEKNIPNCTEYSQCKDEVNGSMHYKCIKYKTRHQYEVGEFVYCHDKVVGVVFYDDGNVTKALALCDITEKSNCVGYDYGGNNGWYDRVFAYNDDRAQMTRLPGDKLSPSQAAKDTDGKGNTAAIEAKKFKSEILGKDFNVIKTVRNYQPDECDCDFCKQGNWYLPAAGEVEMWRTPNAEKNAIRKALIDKVDVVGHTTEQESYYFTEYKYYWTSTGGVIKNNQGQNRSVNNRDHVGAYVWQPWSSDKGCPYDGTVLLNKSNTNHIRPAMQF